MPVLVPILMPVDSARRAPEIWGRVVGMELQLGYDALRVAADDVAAAVGELDGAGRRCAGEVDRLLDGGWRGAAADAFASAWSDWLAGAVEVRAALAAIGDAIATSERLATTADAGSAVDLGSLHGRVGR